MNHSFHSARLKRYMKKPLITMVSAGAMLFFYPLHSFAAPQDGLVVKGSASISQDGASTLINQGSARAVIDWRGFDINSNERVQFIQASQNSIALNRVTGGNPTSILGQLAANGRVFISNPNGVVFGAGAKVDVASLMATTLSVNADDFMNGKNTFSQDLAHSPSYVVNQGEIRIADNGFCFLVAPGVENSGTIIAQLGKVVMASGDALTIDFNGDGLLTYTVSGKILDSITAPDGKPFDAAVSNTGSIKAPGGNIVLIGNGAKDAFASVVNNSGIIEATSLDVKAGSVILNAGDGDAVVTGSINVSGLGAGQVGGKVEVLGDRVGLFGKAAIDALGAAGGGTVLVGGDLHGQGGVPTASQTVVGSDATIKANATDVGQGGKVVVWADNTTSFYGNIEARGGAAGGNGGFVETSGKQTLAFNGSVDTRAAQGLTGTLLLDPTNITISIDSQSMSMAYDGTFSDTTTSPSNLITSSLKSALDTSNVTVDTASSLPGAGFIVVVDPVSWPSGNSLTLKARDAITVNPSATITNTGPGGLNFYADGAVTLNASVSLGGGAFNVAGYGGVGTTASSFAATSAGSITTGGSVNIATRGNIDLGNNVMAGIGGVTLTTDAGGTTRLAGNVTTKGGAITVQSPLILASNVVLDTTNGGVVPAGSAINLASVEADDAAAQNRTLALNAGTGGATSVSGSIGATQSLAGLSVVNSNGATFNGAVRVTDGPGLVNLIDTTAGQSISFVNGLRATALNTSMKGFNLSLLGADTHIVNPVTFLNTGTLALGASATDALSFDGGLTADVSSLIMLAGQLNASGAGISLMAPTAITASTTLSGTGSFLLNSVILADGVTLMVGQGGNNSVILGTVDGTMGGMSSNLTINTTGDVSLGAIGGAMGSDMGDVTILNSGTTTFGGSLIGLRSLTTDAGGTTRLGANVTTTGGNITFGDSLILTGNASLNSGSGTITFSSTVDATNAGVQSLTLNAGTGDVLFSGVVGGSTGLGSIDITNVRNLTAGAITAARLTSHGTGIATLNGDLTMTGDGLNGGVDISASQNLLSMNTVSAVNANLRFGGNSPSSGDTVLANDMIFTTTGSGTVNFDGSLGSQSLPRILNVNLGTGWIENYTDGAIPVDVRLLGGSSLLISGNYFIPNAGLTYNVPVQLGGNVIFSPSGGATLGDLQFKSTVDSNGTPWNLGITALGSVQFDRAVGHNNLLGDINITSGHNLSISSSLAAKTFTSNVLNTTTLGGNITTTGAAGVNISSANTLLVTDVTFNAGSGAIRLNTPVNGAYLLTLDSSGLTSIVGTVGISALTTDAQGTTEIWRNVTTSGDQFYNDAVILKGDATLASNAPGNITFGSTIDGTQSLTVNTAGSTIFGGAVGNSSGLYSLTTDAPGTTRIGGNIRTVGFQSYNDAVILMGNVTLNGDNIAFDSTIDATSAGAQSLTVNAFGSTVFGRDVGSTTVLASLTTDAPGNTFLGGNNITTTGAQSYNDVVFLSGNAVLTSGIGPITFQSSIDGGFALTLNTGGMVAVNGNIGSSNVLGSLILANSAGATFNAINAGTLDLHDTSGSITVNGNLNLNTLVTASKGYNLSLLGSNNHIVNAATFLNTGTLTLGDSVTDSMSFDGGLTAIAPGSINLAGTITARNAAVTLGGSTLTSNVIIDTSQAPGNPLGGDIFLNGIWNAPGGSSLTLRGGSAVGGILINARMGQTNSPGALSVTSAGQVTINESITATNNIDITAAGAVDVTVTNRTAVDNITQVKSVNGNISITAPHTTLRDSAIPTAARLYARGSGSSAITVNGPLTIESHDFSLAQVVSDLFVSGVTSDLYLGSDASATPTCDDATMDALLAGSSTLSLTTSGNIIIDCANATFPAGAGTANVTLNAGGTINDNGIGLALRTTGTLTLTAGGAIGGLNDGLSLDVSRINVIGTGNNNVNITNAGTVGDGTYSIDLGASNVTNGIISINQLQNNLIIGSGGLDAGLAGSVNLTVNAGAVLDGNTVGNDIIANTLIVNAVTGAGSIANPIETQVANLTINNTGAGDISFFEADGLTLTAAAGQPGLKAANGNISFGAGGTIIANSDILASGTLILTNSGGANFAGITAGTLDLQDTNGSIVVNGNLSLNTLTTATKGYSLSLLGSNNQIASAVTFLNTGTLTLGDASADLLTFTGGLTANAPGSINLAGTLTATNSAITFGRPLTLTGNTTINTNGGALSLSALDGGSYNLMAETGTLTLSGAINTTNTGNTTLKTTTGDIVLSNSVGNATGNTTLISAGKITGAGLVSGNEVTLDSATGVGTGTGGRVNTSATTLAARSRTSGGVYVNELDGVTLNAIGGVANNAFGTAYDLTAGGTITVSGALNTATTGNTLLRATTGDIVLDAIAGNTTANMTLTSAGAISQVAGFVIANQVTLAAGSGSDITLDSATNNFGTVSITSGKNVTLVDADALDLGVSTITGNFDVTAGGAITDSGALAVTGTTTLSAGADDITLDSAPNNFSTVSITSGKNVTLVDATALDLGVSTVMGNLDVTAGGAITDSGALAVTGTTLLSAGANDITLDTATNNFSTVAISSGKNVSLVDSNALDLGASTISGNLDVTAGGAITDSGALAVTGKATLSAGANDITLDTATNNFGTVVISSGKNVTLVDANTIDLGASTVSGTLDVTAGGAITDSGALAVTGTTTLSAGANDITLDTATNNFSTVLVKNGKNVSLVDANAINLGAAIVDGTLDVKAGGAITDSDALSVTGTTTLSAGANDITLDTASNNFSTVAITSGKKVTLVDLNSIDLGSSSISDNLNVTAGGAITDTGASVVTAHDMVLSGQGGIGSSVAPIKAVVTNLDVTATDASAGIYLAGQGALSSIVARTNNGTTRITFTGGALSFDEGTALFNSSGVSLVTFNNTGGNIVLGTVNAGSGTANLTASGSILDDIAESADDPVADITAQTVNLAVTGESSTIGTARNPLEINVVNLNALTAGGGIFLNDIAGGVAVGLVDAGGTAGGTVNLKATNGSIIESGSDPEADLVGETVTLEVTGSGSTIGTLANTLEIDAGEHTLNAKSEGGSINLNDTEGGFGIGLVDAGGTAGGDVTLTATGGSITESGADTSADIVGKTVNLTVTGSSSTIGSGGNALEIDAATLDASTAGGNINLHDIEGGFAAGRINAGGIAGGDVMLTVTNGNIMESGSDPDIIGKSVRFVVNGEGGYSIGESTNMFQVDAESLHIFNPGGKVFIDLNGTASTFLNGKLPSGLFFDEGGLPELIVAGTQLMGGSMLDQLHNGGSEIDAYQFAKEDEDIIDKIEEPEPKVLFEGTDPLALHDHVIK